MAVKSELKSVLPRRKTIQPSRLSLKEERSASYKKVSSILQKDESERTEEEKEVLHSCTELVDEVTQRIKKRQRVKDRLQEKEDPPEILAEKCHVLAKAILDSHHLVVYTGAGISTAACIPDYRGTNGIWTLLQQGKDIGLHDLSSAEPTLTHMALSELHRVGVLKHVVSQNCDGLHLRSGLPKTALSEVHGNMNVEVCRECKPPQAYWRLFDVTQHTARFSHRTMRRCYTCQKPLIDTIVHFGERGTLQWPLNWPGACQAAEKADMILCIGSSLKVLKKYPWLWGMDRPVKKRPKLYIVNLQWTPKDDHAVLKISGKCDVVMLHVMSHLNLKIPKYDRCRDPIFIHATSLHPRETHTTVNPQLKQPSADMQDPSDTVTECMVRTKNTSAVSKGNYKECRSASLSELSSRTAHAEHLQCKKNKISPGPMWSPEKETRHNNVNCVEFQGSGSQISEREERYICGSMGISCDPYENNIQLVCIGGDIESDILPGDGIRDPFIVDVETNANDTLKTAFNKNTSVGKGKPYIGSLELKKKFGVVCNSGHTSESYKALDLSNRTSLAVATVTHNSHCDSICESLSDGYVEGTENYLGLTQEDNSLHSDCINRIVCSNRVMFSGCKISTDTKMTETSDFCVHTSNSSHKSSNSSSFLFSTPMLHTLKKLQIEHNYCKIDATSSNVNRSVHVDDSNSADVLLKSSCSKRSYPNIGPNSANKTESTKQPSKERSPKSTNSILSLAANELHVRNKNKVACDDVKKVCSAIMCSFCKLQYNSLVCLFYTPKMPDFGNSVDETENSPAICECCDIDTDDSDETDPGDVSESMEKKHQCKPDPSVIQADDDTEVSPHSSEACKPLTKVPNANPGWYGKGYRKRTKKKKFEKI